MDYRIANIVVGVWLFISAFVWPHTAAQMTNTWILGVLCVAFALIAMAAPQARFLNTALAVWLFISVFVLPTQHRGTVWNNIICAIVIFAISLMPSARQPLVHRPARGTL